jgi:hypothetical protein
MLSIIRELVASQFRALAAIRAARAFGWAWDLPDDHELLND